ncbi:hypothetical protein RhiirA5_432506 [Rhizophagus irregularis]|uniref:Uncharacterized protein n=1 Tax=Rhizophagus irregularis TaxID=588596 RepID=A0A2N0NT88_9GLOM|nr:hypothetical protein RhiirA5_432506 [Rhizophagus irregularis]
MSWACYHFIAKLSAKGRLVKKRTHIQKNREKIECLIIGICNIKICLDNPQKAIIQKQEYPKIITIAQHNALVLPIFIRLSTGVITHIDWYYMIDSNKIHLDKNLQIYDIDNTIVNLGAAFYTNNEEGEYSVYSSLSLWPSSIRVEIVAIFLALLTAPENFNVTIYTDSLGAINSINSAFDSTTRK